MVRMPYPVVPLVQLALPTASLAYQWYYWCHCFTIDLLMVPVVIAIVPTVLPVVRTLLPLVPLAPLAASKMFRVLWMPLVTDGTIGKLAN